MSVTAVPDDAGREIRPIDGESHVTLHYRISVDRPVAGVDPGTETDAATPAPADGAADPDELVSTFGSKPATLQLGAGQLSPMLEQRLVGLVPGDHRVFELGADDAFGPRNPALIQRVSRRVLEAESDAVDYAAGDVVEFNAPGGGRYAGVFRSMDDEYAVFDFNHPLAGKPVRFEVQIIGVLS